MFKKKNFMRAFILTAVIAALALIGTGYAAWTFSKDATVSATGNTSITDVTVVGELTVNKSTFYLVLDQEKLGWYESTDGSGTAITSVELTYTGDNYTDTAVESEIVSFSVTVTNELSEYVTVGEGSFDQNGVTYTGSAIKVNYTLPTVSWVTDKKPSCYAEYTTMKTALTGKTVAFEFKATVA